MSNEPREWSLKGLADETGVPERTIRFYISRGLVDPPLRGGRGAAYGGRHKERLEAIRGLQAKGMMLAEISHALSFAEEPISKQTVDRLEEPDAGRMPWFEKDGGLEESQLNQIVTLKELRSAPALPEAETWRSYGVAPDVRVMFKPGASPWRTKALMAALRWFIAAVNNLNAKEDKSD